MSLNISGMLFKTLSPSMKHMNTSVRLYGRWMHRKTAKVLLPFERPEKVSLKKEKVISLEPDILNPSCGKDTKHLTNAQDIKKEPTTNKVTLENSSEIKTRREEKLNKRKFYLSQQKVFDDNNQIIFEKVKETDGRITSLLTNMKSKKNRHNSKQILVEGWRLIMDGLEAKCNLKYVIFSRTEDLNNIRPFLPKTGVKFFKIPYKAIELWSDVETSPGIVGVFEMPTEHKIKRLSKPLPFHLICDNVRVPGNLGAILRAAVGAGCEKVLLSKGCVDVWEPKVLRSAAGAHFRLPIEHSVDWTDMPNHLEENTSIFIADSNAKVIDEEEPGFDGLQIPVLPYYSIEYASMYHITLVVGGETEGISEESYRLAASRNGLRLNIPLQKGVDSLNTGMATAIIAFEIRKQLTQVLTKLQQDRKFIQTT